MDFVIVYEWIKKIYIIDYQFLLFSLSLLISIYSLLFLHIPSD